MAVSGVAISGIPQALGQAKFTPGDVYGGMHQYPFPTNPSTLERVPAASEGGTAAIPLTTVPGRTMGQIAWSPDRKFAYVTAGDKVLRVTAAGEVSDFMTITYPTGIIVLPDGTVLCASYSSHRVFDITNGTASVYAAIDRPLNLLRTSDGRILCTQNRGSFDNPARVWDITNPASPVVFATIPDNGADLVQLSDGRILCAVPAALNPRVLDITGGGTFTEDPLLTQRTFASGRQFFGLAEDRDGRVLASVVATTGIWDITNGGSFSGQGPTYATANTGTEALDTVPNGTKIRAIWDS